MCARIPLRLVELAGRFETMSLTCNSANVLPRFESRHLQESVRLRLQIGTLLEVHRRLVVHSRTQKTRDPCPESWMARCHVRRA